MTDKELLRRKMNDPDNFLTETELADEDKMIRDNLSGTDMYLTCDLILSYVSRPGSRSRCPEADTVNIIRDSLGAGKTVGCPIVTGPHSMIFKRITSEDDLRSGSYGIREPMQDSPDIILNDFKNILVLVPGVAFDKKGGRLGHGRGYYDIWLGRYSRGSGRNYSIRTCGLAYDFQVVRHVPAEEHDIAMDAVITPSHIYGWRNF